MLWMETYCLYCSVRLGVLIISILAFISTFIPSILFFTFGLDLLNPILNIFNEDDHFRDHRLVKTFTNMVDSDSDKLLVLIQLYLFAHMACSIVAFYGAWKIKKYFVIPLSIFEFARVLYCLVSHILLMTVCKNRLNLGILIIATLSGGFVILYLGYNWTTIVALYQIITLINSERYKSFYGDDPFHPLIPKTYTPWVRENVQVLVTPVDSNRPKPGNGLINHPNVIQQQPLPIIAVIPANLNKNWFLQNENSNRGTQQKWASPSQQREMDNNKSTSKNDAYDNSYMSNYANWQWSELAPSVPARNKQNLYGYNLKY